MHPLIPLRIYRFVLVRDKSRKKNKTTDVIFRAIRLKGQQRKEDSTSIQQLSSHGLHTSRADLTRFALSDFYRVDLDGS